MMVIETVRAIRLLGHSRQGQTLPLLLECDSKDGPVVYQTKITGRRSGLSHRELCRELVGTLTAAHCDLQVAQPAVVLLSHPVVEQIERNYEFGITSEVAVGFVWKQDLVPYIPIIDRVRVPREVQVKLLGLDLALANGDRSVVNPNVAWLNRELFVFDFEHCLELPNASLEDRLESHLSLLVGLMEGHLFKVETSYGLIKRCLKAFVVSSDVLYTEARTLNLPTELSGEWSAISGYLEYLEFNHPAVVEALVGLVL